VALDSTPYRKTNPDRFRRACKRVSNNAALLLAHLCIGRASDPVGIVEIDLDFLRVDLHSVDPEPLVRELTAAGLLVYDPDNGIAYVVGWCIDDPPQNPSHRTSMERRARRFPSGTALAACLSEIAGTPYRHPADTLPTPTAHPADTLPTPEFRIQNSDPNPVADEGAPAGAAPASQPPDALALTPDKPKRKRSLAQDPPTEAETVAIFRDLGAQDPDTMGQRCLAYWQSAGFARKSGPVKDWAATCRTWLGNARDRGEDRSAPPAAASRLRPPNPADFEPRKPEPLMSIEERKRRYFEPIQS
jgi:hypothetical protein